MRNPCWNEPVLRDFHGYLYTVNNGGMDVEGFIDPEYGEEIARRLQIRARIENDHEEAKRYYASVGPKKEYLDWDDYDTRWTLLTPMNTEPGKVYPLVFWLHGGGNSIEAEENMTGYTDIAAREGFMLAVPQNTSPDKVYRFVSVQNTPHWPQLSMGELGWKFMKRFSRNTETGELIIAEE